MRILRISAAILAGLVASSLAAQSTSDPEPISILRQGSFSAGVNSIEEVTDGSRPGRTMSCGHGYVEYQIPTDPRALPLFFWHSSSTFVWANRWDGAEGFQSIFLRKHYPIMLWDGPRVGRANWGCESYTHEPVVGADQQNFTSWRFGNGWLEWFDGVQFPTDDPAALDQAMRARYQEFDRIENIHLEAAVAASAFDKIGPSVAVTSSAGGTRALLAATQTDKIRAIIAYENPGYLFPEGEGPEGPDTPFGPLHIDDEAFEKLTQIPMQFVWGDNIEANPIWTAKYAECVAFVAMINARGGQAEILRLTDHGLTGNTHMPFADMNNLAVAALMEEFLSRHGLDARP